MTQAIGAAAISFDPGRHEYRRPDGASIPSVTQILRAVGVSVDFDDLASRSRRTAEAITAKRDLGVALHQDAHAYDDDDLVWSSVDSRVEPYLRAWATFRENTGLVPVTRERRVWHPGVGYAGTLDGVFLDREGTLVLVDIKTGDPDASGCQFQTAAYLEAFRLEHPQYAVTHRWGVHLAPDRQVPYRIAMYRDWRDFSTFQSFVITYYQQAARRVRGLHG